MVACHPTPPVFDGPEKRNLNRNADELKLLDAIISDENALRDDNGLHGGVCAEMPFVVMGDLNADSANGDGDKAAILSLINHPRVNANVSPSSIGAIEYFANKHVKNEALATHNRGLRLDYVLPSRELTVKDCGVFWPRKDAPLYSLLTDNQGRLSFKAPSDHRLVWVDIDID